MKRNRKDKNLAGLYTVPNNVAYKNGKLRKGVYGVIGKDTPYIYKPAEKQKDKPRTFVRDSTDLPKVCKNRVLAFWDDKNNKGKTVCYLAEKSLYEEMRKSKTSKTKKPKQTNKPVYPIDKDFDLEHRGRIKGSYNCDGFFEPD